jgi:two-component system NarL family sensor kinase
VIPTVPPTMLVAIVVVGLVWAGGGTALVFKGGARPAAWMVVLTGCAAVGAAVLIGTGFPTAGWRVLMLSAAVLLPLAVSTFPVLRWRHPVDFVALTVIAASGALLVVQADDPALVGVFGLVSAVAAFGHTWWRVERSQGIEHRALLWLAVVGGAVGLLIGVLDFAFEGNPPPEGTPPVLLLALVPAAMYVGAVLPDIVDVRGVVVGAAVVTMVVLSYLALFVIIGSLLELVAGRAVSIGTLGLVGALTAAGFRPLQTMLRGSIDELLFGHRPDPLDAASHAVGHFRGDTTLALAAIREALVLPYVALRDRGHTVSASGEETVHTRTIRLAASGSELIVGLRPGDLSLSRDDQLVLGLVAPMLEQTLEAQALAAQVQQSRDAIVGAVAEERRRLRRDLHDGLGPRLSGIAFTSDAARNLVRSDPGGAEELLARLRAETVVAIDEIRQLVYAMRPPAIDELGLVPALRQSADRLRNAAGAPVVVEVRAPEQLPTLSAATEVAVYRIVIEALTNVARHTRCDAATVALDVHGSELVVVVTDAAGMTAQWHAGVGLSSMSERAAEVGGTLSAGSSPTGGRVEARLPLLASPR